MRAADSPALQRYADIAQILTGQPTATAADGVLRRFGHISFGRIWLN